jgi:hypothetical protein
MFGGCVLRAQSVVAASVFFLVGAFLIPACSTTNEDGPGCTNGARDRGEDGIDCGGVCPTKCTGSPCTTGEDCANGKCENGACGAPAGKSCGVGAPTTCNEGDGCQLNEDCKTGFCNNSVCGPIGPTDGKKNQEETDVDCGGPTAPKCAVDKACLVKTDCIDDYCPDATKKCTAPTYDDGVLNGTETDIDCGGSGAGMKKCAETKACAVDADCFGACNYLKKCVDAPSCKGNFGGDTCGAGGPGTPLAPNHESCCKTLEVKGYTDPIMPPGKTKVYLDKYEITAGRMRAFLEAIGGGVDGAGNAQDANIKAYMAAHRPNRWNPEWENTLPTANANSMATYTITNPTGANLLYPGNDLYTSAAWNPRLVPWQFATGTQTIDIGAFNALGAAHFFPEAFGGTPADYGASHALNCSNSESSYGYSTYWFDANTVATYSGGIGKFFSKNELDEKSLTCAPNGLLAAFCAWDGGQLATEEVIDNITGNTVSPVYGIGSQNGKLAPGQSNCGPGANSYITYSDGASPCFPYFYPNDMGNDYDGSSRIAPPGRMPLDVISKNVGDEPWMDLIGNLHEAVLKGGETMRFDYRGYGHEYGSILYHKLEQTTARFKSGAMGGRCMRFK